MEIKSVKDFRETVAQVRAKEFHRQVFEGNHHRAVFRGQEVSSWNLIPKLLRYNQSLEDIKLIEHNLLADFRQQLVTIGCDQYFQGGFLGKQNFHSDWLFIQQAQHVGLATRFMDWSLNAEIACFFACLGSPDNDGAFYVLYPEADWFQADRPNDNYADIDPLLFPEIVVLNPSGYYDQDSHLKFLERFKMRQAGRFLVQPITDASMQSLTAQPFFENALEKHVIHKDAKNALLQEFGLTTDFVYMESDALVQKIHPAIKDVINDLHKKYNLI